MRNKNLAKKKKKILTDFGKEREKNLAKIGNFSVILIKWEIFSHKNLGPE